MSMMIKIKTKPQTHKVKRRRKMKKTLLLAATTVLVVMLGICAGYAQPMGPGMMGPGYGYPEQEGWNYCPYCGSYTYDEQEYKHISKASKIRLRVECSNCHKKTKVEKLKAKKK